MIMMTFYLESKYGEPWVTDSTLNYTVEQLQEGLEWIQSLEDNHVMPDLKTMNAAGDKTITDGQAWITGKYAGIFTWDSSALSASQNLPDDAEYVVGDEIKWGERNYVDGIDESFTAINYPFVMSDGITLFFAAKGDKSVGGYDIFTTTFDSESGKFYQPQNYGLPLQAVP